MQIGIMRILITAGGTREYIDPVRFITNASSGRMGYAMAGAAIKAGHKVTLITATTSLLIPDGAQVINVETSAQMFEAVKKYFVKCDCLIMAAAVADYTPVKKSKVKIKKSNRNLIIRLKPTDDILKWVGKHKKVNPLGVKSKKHALSKVEGAKGKRQIIVGFALEDKGLRQNAEKKLKDKNLDMIVANTPAAVGSDKSTVHIKTAESTWEKIENTGKSVIAERIICLAAKLWNQA